MFYSHTFLARKGPLGTVWCAAHLQHKLKKSHYTSTNVFSTAERIMNPEAPIALRMYGHLLLGIVRIYSKQVDYLHQDCYGALILLTRVCPSLKLNELDPASPDPNSVLLPKRFKLDEVMVDEDAVRLEDDRHVKNTEDITLPDHPSVIAVQNAINNVPQVILNDTSVPEDASEPMEQDPVVMEEIVREKSHIDVPERERMRDRDRDHDTLFEPVTSVIGDLMGDRIEPDGHLEERFRRDASRSPPSGLHELHEMPSAGSEDFAMGLLHDHPSVTAVEDVVTGVTQADTSVPEGASEQPMPMDEDPALLVPEENTENHDTGINVPDIEVMRDRDHDTVRGQGTLEIDDFLGDRIESDGRLEEQNKRDASKSPTNIPNEHSEMPSVGLEAFEQGSSDGRGTPDFPIPFTYPVDKSVEMVLRDSPTGPGSVAIELPPTPQVVQQRVRQRKRKIDLYDRATVLTNDEMKENREDTSNLLRKKRLRRIDNVGVWKQQNRLKKDAIFFEPVITGLSSDLDIVFDPTKIHSKPLSIASSKNRDGVPESPVRENRDGVPESPVRENRDVIPESPVRVVNDDMEIEHPRNFEDPNNVDIPMSAFSMPSPQQNICDSDMRMASSSRRDIYTPTTIDTNVTSNSDRHGTITTPEFTGSTTDPETSTCLREGRIGQYSPLSDIPESEDSPRHLDFLENDDNSPTGTPRSVGVGEKEVLQFDTLPAKTRAVGQYFKKQSTGTPNSSEFSSETLKLDSILESKTKKICARMFFETLVLKSYGFIDVKQEEPYSEIKLKVTSKLKEQCSA